MTAPGRILIDGYNLALPRGTGVATYGFNLALAIQGMGLTVEGLYGLRAPFSQHLREVTFYQDMNGDRGRPARLSQLDLLLGLPRLVLARKARELPPPGQGEVETGQFEHRLPAFSRLYSAPDLFETAHRHFRRFGRFMRVQIPDPPAIMHWTYPLPLKLEGARNIYTLHDLVPLRLPYATLDNKRLYSRLVRQCVLQGDQICTVSESSFNDITRMLGAEPDKVSNTGQAVRPIQALLDLSDDEIAQSLRSTFNLPYKGYFLFFGAIEPKKNVGRLIEAYLSLSTHTPLVIAGERAWGCDAELRLLQRDELQPLKATFRNIRRIDYLPRSLLMRLVRGAKAVAFPSLYEGFGLPALEAMMMGTPVLTTNTSSLPEVVGDAALTVDPFDVGAIAKALRELDEDAVLRAGLSAAGVKRATNFDMQSYQKRLQAMYDKVLSR